MGNSSRSNRRIICRRVGTLNVLNEQGVQSQAAQIGRFGIGAATCLGHRFGTLRHRRANNRLRQRGQIGCLGGRRFTSSGGSIGTINNGVGTVTIAEVGSSWVNSAGLVVGDSGDGVFAVLNGAGAKSRHVHRKDARSVPAPPSSRVPARSGTSSASSTLVPPVR